jgi:hypothetical protein
MPDDPKTAVGRALAFWGNPAITRETRDGLIAFAGRVESAATTAGRKKSYPILRQNALRMLVATSPDFQTC